MTSVATPDRETHSASAAEPGARWLRHRLAAGVASGLLLWTAFPPMEWAPLAWVAPGAPLLAGHGQGVAAEDLRLRLGGRLGVLDPGRPLAPFDRPRGVDRLGRPGAGLLALVAAVPGR